MELDYQLEIRISFKYLTILALAENFTMDWSLNSWKQMLMVYFEALSPGFQP